jgi:hypothetical protein
MVLTRHMGFLPTPVQLDYSNFRPNGHAYLIFRDESEAADARYKLKNGATGLTGVYTRPVSALEKTEETKKSGSGPNAGLNERGRVVVLSGFQNSTPAAEILEVLNEENIALQQGLEHQGVERRSM